MAERASSAAHSSIDNLYGAQWMICSSACFALSYAISKYLATYLPPVEIVFVRCLFGLAIVAPAIARHGFGIYRTESPGVHVVRVICASLALICGYYALAYLPFATAISLQFTRPLFMILIAVAILGEKVRWRRGLATLVGFIGVVIVVGPTDLGSLRGALIALMGAAFTSGALAVVGRQAGTDNPATIMVWFATGTAVVTALPGIYVWQTPPSLEIWLLLAFTGILGTVGQYFLIRALVHGEITAVNPVDYSQILISAAVGYFVFNETPSASLWIGAAIIVASTLYILFRSADMSGGGQPRVTTFRDYA